MFFYHLFKHLLQCTVISSRATLRNRHLRYQRIYLLAGRIKLSSEILTVRILLIDRTDDRQVRTAFRQV